MRNRIEIKTQFAVCYRLVQSSERSPWRKRRATLNSIVQRYSSSAAGISSAALLMRLAGKAALFSRMSISIS